MLYRISVTERGLTGIANIFRSRLSRLDDLLGAGTVPLTGGPNGTPVLRDGPPVSIIWPTSGIYVFCRFEAITAQY